MKAVATLLVAFCLGATAQANHVISESYVSNRPVVSVRTTVTDLNVESVIENSIDQAYAQISYNGLIVTGSPFVRYHSNTNATYYVVEAGVPVTGLTTGVPVSMRSSLPSGRIASTRHLGLESNLFTAYDSLERYFFAYGRVSRGAPWEIYHDDPNLGIEVVWPIAVGVPGPAPAP